MGKTQRWKVYDTFGLYEASAVQPETAAAIVAFLGAGATIRDGHRQIVWYEGHELYKASESFDGVAATILVRSGAPR